MAILDATAQEIVTMTRAECGRQGAAAVAAAGLSGPRTDRIAADIAEVVMGSDAWDKYKNSAYTSMTGPRKPQGKTATAQRTKERKLKLKGSLVGWSLQHEPQHFAGEDTRWGSATHVAAAKRRRERSAFRDTGKHDFGSLPPAQECSGRQKKTRREEGRQEVIDGLNRYHARW